MIFKKKIKKIYLFIIILNFFNFNDLFTENKFETENTYYFICNQGQLTDENGNKINDILYYYKNGKINIYFHKYGMIYYLKEINTLNEDFLEYNSFRFDVEFVNSNKNIIIEAIDTVTANSNFYFQNCPNGITNVKEFKKIIYKNIYKNIDLVFYFNETNNAFKYDFILHPYSNPQDIKLKYNGAKSILINNGNLVIKTPICEIVEQKPFAYVISNKSSNSILTKVKAEFSIKNKIVSYKLGNYNKNNKLVIDPNVIWSRFFGAAGVDHSYAVATDSLGNSIITGNTLSDDLPVSVGAFQTRRAGLLDIYIAKFDQNGKRLWSTYYGGTESDYSSDICCDRDNNVIVTGWTWSKFFPISSNAFQQFFGGKETDAIILKFDQNGKRIWATFCGGDSSEHAYGIGCDAHNRIAITGWTLSSNFPTTENVEQKTKSGVEDAYLILIDSSCNLLFGTYYGGDSSDIARSVAFDNFGNIAIVGFTKSPNLKFTSDAFQKSNKGEYDAFFSLFDIYGVLTFGTYYGGNNHDYAYDVAFDRQGNAIFTGYTMSSDFPVSPTAYQKYIKGGSDVFVVKMNTFGMRHWATFFGGSSEDYAQTLAIDKDGNIAVGGKTYSYNFPITDGAFQDKLSGLSDAFVFKISSRGTEILWSSFFGGFNEEWGYGLANDIDNKLYFTGDTESQNFPILNTTEQQRIAGLIDAFLMRLCPTNPNPVIKHEGSLNLCIGDSVILDAGEGYSKYIWSTGQFTRKITVKNPGQYTVTVYDINNCPATSKPVTIYVAPEVKPKITGELVFCEGDSTILDAGGGYQEYLWTTGAKTQRIIVKNSGKYKVSVKDFNGCSGSDSVQVLVNKNPLPVIKGPKSVCAFSKNVVYYISGVAENSYFWKVTGGSLRYGVDSISIFVDWGSGGTYKISIKEVNERTGCVGYDTITVIVSNELHPQIVSNSGKFEFCDGDSITLDAGEGYSSYYWSNGERTRFIKLKNSAFLSVTVRDNYGCEGKDTVTILKLPNPQPTISGTNLICKGNTSIYSSPFYKNHLYNWKVKNGKMLKGNGFNEIEILWDTIGLGTIELEEIDTITGCSASAVPFKVEVKPLPICKISYQGKLEFCDGDSVILDAGHGYSKYTWNTGNTEHSIIAKTSGIYKVQVEDENGCTATDSIVVIVHSNPEKPIITERKDSLFSTKAEKYQWFLDGTKIEGATDQIFIAKSTGFYTVLIQNEFGCSAISDRYYAWRGSADAKVFMPDTIFVRTGEKFTLTLDMVESHNLNRKGVLFFDAFLRYNPYVMLPLGDYEPIEFKQDLKTIKISGQRTDTICLLTSLEFATALGNEKCSTIFLDSLVWREDFVFMTLNNTVVCFTNLCEADGTRLIKPTGTIHLNSYPNPTNSDVIIEYEIIESGNISIKLYNTIGYEVLCLFEGIAKPGIYTYQLNTDILTSGSYICILKTDSHILSNRIDIIK